ncbi:AI-2E family transporter [Roseibium sediminicola]|uniref:AI-2E family transporter n=1 Tax=Roseibium sediminicola TaxID=2933272 RepID=A0ABT0H093_9HYPH|nr:AI-2E family transporter [Roseibium sp. CAU 1639]MCK7615107.1 AI-2E family transporter [Roseibium sp. CAU 1639]
MTARADATTRGNAVPDPVQGSGFLDEPLARAALYVLAAIAVTAALDIGQVIFAPVCLSVVVGSLFGPAADRLARIGVASWISAASMVLLFILLIFTAGAAFVVPLSDWLDKLPLIWARLQAQLISWQGFFTSLSSLQEELRNMTGSASQVKVSVDDTSAVESVFYFAPAFVAQVILFLASLYFFILTRPYLRRSALELTEVRENRRYISAAFRTIEERLSAYLLSITFINLALGGAVAFALWLLDVPSALLWGMLAGMLNYVVYVGPALMTVVMAGVGLATGNTIPAILTPPLVYLGLNLIEAQFVTPMVLGRTMTLNPFVVFLTIAFWIWLWGPVGGFVAVPLLLVAVSLIELRTELPGPE